MTTDTIEIATGSSVTTKFWKNEVIKWDQLIEQLLTPIITHETLQEYEKATKDERDKIKDVGGYVGGYLSNGKRQIENVSHRQLITLDIDNVTIDTDQIWEQFILLFDCEAIIHSTHSYTQKNPRYRLIIPLLTPVIPDAYKVISRHIADQIGMEVFDPTTFDINRLMFWPSCSIDADFYSRRQKGKWINPENILKQYEEWENIEGWKTSKSDELEIKNNVKKQSSPVKKGGVVGAFCRAYPIREAINIHLKDVYALSESPTDKWIDTRYTYINGTTKNGVVIYDDLFSYSHHGTDPSQGVLCNAFDLVRIHKFGHLDNKKTPTTVKSPSFIKMESFCLKDKKVKMIMAKENKAFVKDNFPEYHDEKKDNTKWITSLDINKQGVYLSNAKNLNVIFQNDSILDGSFAYNSFDDRPYIMRSLPWRTIKEREPLRNVDYSGIRNYLEITYGIIAVSKIFDSLNIILEKKKFHPVKEYLDPLEWDGEKRIDTLLIDYFGADDNVYTREAIRKMMVGAIARIYDPGIKFDLVLTLIGDHLQGTGKSTFLNRLGVHWYSDSFQTFTGNQSFEQLKGAWIIEMAELSRLYKKDIEAVKHFITKQSDIFRPAYGHVVETFKRQCVFFATTNKNDFLTDPTGNRRFMPIDVNEEKIKKSALDENELLPEQISKIWAEAKYLYFKGEKLFLSEESEAIAQMERKEHQEYDNREGTIQAFLDKLLPSEWENKSIEQRILWLDSPSPFGESGIHNRQFVCIAEIWCECLMEDKSKMNAYNTKSLNTIMKGLSGWSQSKKGQQKRFSHYGKQRFYKRDDIN